MTLIVTGWVAYARVLRLQARSLRAAEWMQSAKAIGATPARVLARHLLPNLTAPAAVLATQQAGAMILYESSLSFLGLGIGGSTVTWGGMAALGREAIFKAPWVAAIPGLAIALAILGFNLTGDWLATRGVREVGWRHEKTWRVEGGPDGAGRVGVDVAPRSPCRGLAAGSAFLLPGMARAVRLASAIQPSGQD